MKTTPLHFFPATSRFAGRCALPLLIAAMATHSALAVTQYATSGPFTWNNASTAAWSTTSGGPYTSTWISGSDAVFEGAGGTVTIASPTAHNLTFNTTGYILSGASTLTLNTASATITTGSGITATIGNNTATAIAGTVGLIKAGAGTLTLNGTVVNGFTGSLGVSNGTLALDFAYLGAPTNLLNSAVTPLMGGGTLLIKGQTGGNATAQTLGAVTGTAGTTSKMFIDPNGGLGTTLTLTNLTDFTTVNKRGKVLMLGKAAAAGGGTVTINAGTAGSSGRVLYTTDGGTSVDFWGAASGGALSYTTLAAGSSNTSATTYFKTTGSVTLSAAAFVTIAGGIKVEAPAASQSLDVKNGLRLAGLLVTGTDAYEVKTTGTGSQYNCLVIPGGAANAQGALTISQYNTGGLTISAPIENTGANVGDLVKSGPEKLTLSGASTYKGITYINEGTLSVSTLANGGINAGNPTYAAGSPNVTVTSTTSLALGMSFSCDDFPTGTIISSITPPTTVVMSQNAIDLGSGILHLWGTANSLGLAANTATNLVFGGGTLQYTGATTSTDRAFTIVAGKTATCDITNSLTTPGATGTATTGGLTKTGVGTLVLSGTNTYTGPTTISSGTLELGTGGSLAAGTSVSIAAGGTFDLTVPTGSSGTYTWNTASLSAAGTATAATVAGTTGGTINMGVKPISLTYDGSTPPLTVTGASLSLGGNQFTVVVPGTALGAGTYTLVAAAAISGSVNATPLYTGGNGVAGGTTGVVSISGTNVILTVTIGGGATAPAAPTITGITVGNAQLSVAFTAGLDGGSAITDYKYSTDGGTTFLTRQTGTSASPLLITTLSSDGTTPLANGTSYNVQLKAVNVIGDGTATASTAATPQSPYGNWMNTYYPTQSDPKRALNADPDSDGQPNFLEFGLNSNPSSGSSPGKAFAKMATVGADSNVLTLSVAVRDNAAAFAAAGNNQQALDPTDSLTYLIEASTTLTTWGTTAVTPVTGGDATTIQAGLPALDPGWSYKTFRAAGTAGSPPANFIRVMVTTP